MRPERNRTAGFFLPPEAVRGAAVITIKGNSRVSVENHAGILEYTPELLEIRTCGRPVRIRGNELMIAVMNRQEILVDGEIFSVELG